MTKLGVVYEWETEYNDFLVKIKIKTQPGVELTTYASFQANYKLKPLDWAIICVQYASYAPYNRAVMKSGWA